MFTVLLDCGEFYKRKYLRSAKSRTDGYFFTNRSSSWRWRRFCPLSWRTLHCIWLDVI